METALSAAGPARQEGGPRQAVRDLTTERAISQTREVNMNATLLCLLTLSVPGDARPGAPAAGTGAPVKEYKTTQKGVLFTVAAPAETVSGHAFQVALTLGNRGADTVYVVDSFKYADYSIKITKRDPAQGGAVEKEARPTLYGRSEKGTYREVLVHLAPTKSFSCQLSANWLFDLTSPGDYTMSVTKRIFTDPERRAHVDLVVDNIRFRVLETE
jgi:hypothetical protein